MHWRVLVLILTLLTSAALAQSGRNNALSGDTAATATEKPRSGEEMFNDVTDSALKKYQDLEKSKTPYDAALHEQIIKDQKLLAARYAAELSARAALSTEDFYFLGLLQNLSTNFDGAAESFRKYLASEKP
jgi:hypothetical protein